jgi:hypothetical protein
MSSNYDVGARSKRWNGSQPGVVGRSVKRSLLCPKVGPTSPRLAFGGTLFRRD